VELTTVLVVVSVRMNAVMQLVVTELEQAGVDP